MTDYVWLLFQPSARVSRCSVCVCVCVDDGSQWSNTTTTHTTTTRPAGVVTVRQFIVSRVDDNSVTLSWQPPPPASATELTPGDSGTADSDVMTYVVSVWHVDAPRDDVTAGYDVTLVTSSWWHVSTTVVSESSSVNVSLTVTGLTAAQRYCFTVYIYMTSSIHSLTHLLTDSVIYWS